jgi:hypothetical protein
MSPRTIRGLSTQLIILLLLLISMPSPSTAATLSNTGRATVMMEVLELQIEEEGTQDEKAIINGRILKVEVYIMQDSETKVPRLRAGDVLEVRFFKYGKDDKVYEDWDEVRSMEDGAIVRLTLENKADRDDWWVDEEAGAHVLQAPVFYMAHFGPYILLVLGIVVVAFLALRKRSRTRDKYD